MPLAAASRRVSQQRSLSPFSCFPSYTLSQNCLISFQSRQQAQATAGNELKQAAAAGVASPWCPSIDASMHTTMSMTWQQ